MRKGATSTPRGSTPKARKARSSGSFDAPIPVPTTLTCARPSSTDATDRSASSSPWSPWTFSSGTMASASQPSRGQAPCFESTSWSAARSAPRTTSTSASTATPEMRSSRAADFFTSVPGPLWKVLRAWMAMPRSRANSTACAFNTLAPASASSCISSCDSSERRRASATIRGSALKTPSTSEQISQTSASSAAASATAVVSLPPRPRVVTSFSRETPWYPATMTTLPRSSASRIRTGRTSTMRALLWAPSVMMPLCEPVKLTASTPRAWSAIPNSAIEMRSPAVRSMSSSRRCGSSVTLRASASSSSVVSPMAETTTTTG